MSILSSRVAPVFVMATNSGARRKSVITELTSCQHCDMRSACVGKHWSILSYEICPKNMSYDTLLTRAAKCQCQVHYGNQSRGYLIGGRPLWPPAVPRLAARSSQSNPRGSGPEVFKRERGPVTAETGVAEVGVFRALQPNVRGLSLTRSST